MSLGADLDVGYQVTAPDFRSPAAEIPPAAAPAPSSRSAPSTVVPGDAPRAQGGRPSDPAETPAGPGAPSRTPGGVDRSAPMSRERPGNAEAFVNAPDAHPPPIAAEEPVPWRVDIRQVPTSRSAVEQAPPASPETPAGHADRIQTRPPAHLPGSGIAGPTLKPVDLQHPLPIAELAGERQRPMPALIPVAVPSGTQLRHADDKGQAEPAAATKEPLQPTPVPAEAIPISPPEPVASPTAADRPAPAPPPTSRPTVETRIPEPAPRAEAARGPRPMTAAEASRIGPLQRRGRTVAIFGQRRR